MQREKEREKREREKVQRRTFRPVAPGCAQALSSPLQQQVKAYHQLHIDTKKTLKISQFVVMHWSCRRIGSPLGVYLDSVLGGVRLGVYLGGVFLSEDLVIVFLGADLNSSLVSTRQQPLTARYLRSATSLKWPGN